MTELLVMNLVIATSAAVFLLAVMLSSRKASLFWVAAALHFALVVIGVAVTWEAPLFLPGGRLSATAAVLKIYGPTSVILGQLDYHILGRMIRLREQ